jgi:hypothetical protein
MWLFEKKKLKVIKDIPKIVCKIEWIKVGYSHKKYLKTNFGCCGSGIYERFIQVGSGREIASPRRNKQIWTTYPTKTNTSCGLCLRITSTKINTSVIYRFNFWNIKNPKPLGRIIHAENKVSIPKKYSILKRRIERWK